MKKVFNIRDSEFIRIEQSYDAGYMRKHLFFCNEFCNDNCNDICNGFCNDYCPKKFSELNLIIEFNHL